MVRANSIDTDSLVSGTYLGITISSKIEVHRSPLGGMGVFAKRPLATLVEIVSLPKTAALCPRNSSVASILQRLTIATYYYERSLREQSRWYGLIQEFDASEQPDVYEMWTSVEQKYMQSINTVNCTVPYMRQYEMLYSESADLLQRLSELYSNFDIPSREDYIRTGIKMSSRSFGLRKHSGSALIPFAGYFNGTDNPSARFGDKGQGCSSCVAQNMCCADCAYKITSDLVPASDTWCLYACRSIACGEEILINYCPSPNFRLIAGYGFAVWNNRFDMVNLTPHLKYVCFLTKKLAALKSIEGSFFGIIRDPFEDSIRVTKELEKVVHVLRADMTLFLGFLAYSKYASYAPAGSSDDVHKLAEVQNNPRKRTAMIAVATEKRTLEMFMDSLLCE